MTATLVPLPVAPSGSGIGYHAYRGIEEISGMGAANARLRAHAGILDPIDLDAMRHRYTHLVNSDPLVDCVVAELDGSTVGYARAEWHDLADGDRAYDMTIVVEPAAWGLGIAGSLADWCESRLREIGAGHRRDRVSWLSSGTFGGDTELEGVLGDRGYTAVRWDAEMLRPDLDLLPDAAPPAGYEVRSPAPDELTGVFEMTVLAFSEHWGEAVASDQRIEEWVDDPRFRLDLLVVAWADRQPAAGVLNFLEPAPDGSTRGLLAEVSTHPGHRRRGLARACIAESLRRLRDAGATSAYLGVDTDNPNRAMALYESCGFRLASSSTSHRKLFDQGEDDR